MTTAGLWHTAGFYQFTPLPEDRLDEIRTHTAEWMSSNGVMGLVIFATEGVNGTVSGTAEGITAFKSFIQARVDSKLRFKDSTSERAPFHRTSVVVRPEIVSLKRPDLVPPAEEDNHLTPQEWHEFMASDRPKMVVDARNDYETALGKFAGAVDPGIKSFSEWSEFMDRAGIPKDVPVLIYCTGGIRCEKAMQEMRTRGFDEVYQLRDGILGYLAEYPDGFFEGECFIFDDRVALRSDLSPTERYAICPGCGLPGETPVTCDWCEKSYLVCETCAARPEVVCSKTCLDRVRRHGSRVIAR